MRRNSELEKSLRPFEQYGKKGKALKNAATVAARQRSIVSEVDIPETIRESSTAYLKSLPEGDRARVVDIRNAFLYGVERFGTEIGMFAKTCPVEDGAQKTLLIDVMRSTTDPLSGNKRDTNQDNIVEDAEGALRDFRPNIVFEEITIKDGGEESKIGLFAPGSEGESDIFITFSSTTGSLDTYIQDIVAQGQYAALGGFKPYNSSPVVSKSGYLPVSSHDIDLSTAIE